MKSSPLLDHLVKSGIIDRGLIERYREMSRSTGVHILGQMIRDGAVDENEFYSRGIRNFRVPMVSLRYLRIPTFVVKQFTKQFALANGMIPVSMKMEGDEEVLGVACIDPTDREALTEAQKLTQKRIRSFYSPISDIHEAIQRHFKSIRRTPPAARVIEEKEPEAPKAVASKPISPGQSDASLSRLSRLQPAEKEDLDRSSSFFIDKNAFAVTEVPSVPEIENLSVTNEPTLNETKSTSAAVIPAPFAQGDSKKKSATEIKVESNNRNHNKPVKSDSPSMTSIPIPVPPQSSYSLYGMKPVEPKRNNSSDWSGRIRMAASAPLPFSAVPIPARNDTTQITTVPVLNPHEPVKGDKS